MRKRHVQHRPGSFLAYIAPIRVSILRVQISSVHGSALPVRLVHRALLQGSPRNPQLHPVRADRMRLEVILLLVHELYGEIVEAHAGLLQSTIQGGQHLRDIRALPHLIHRYPHLVQRGSPAQHLLDPLTLRQFPLYTVV